MNADQSSRLRGASHVPAIHHLCMHGLTVFAGV